MSSQKPGPAPEAVPARPDGPQKPRRRTGVRVLVVMGGALVAVFAGLYVTAYAVTGSGVLRGTEVLGIDIGGMTPREAEKKLAKELPKVVTRTITVTAGGKEFRLDAAKSGLAVDAKETVARAGSRSLAPSALLPVLFGATEQLDPVLVVDEVALAEAVQGIAEEVDREGKEGKIRFVDGAAKATEGREGRTLDVAGTVDALRQAYRSGSSDVTAPVTVDVPEVGEEAVEAAMREFAQPAMSGPVTIMLHDEAVTLTPRQMDDYLTMVPRDGGLHPEIDAEALADDITEKHADLVKAPQDASFKFLKGIPKVVESQPGEEIDPVALAPKLLVALADAAERTVDADLRDAEAEFTTEDAQALGIKEKISSFRTYYPYAPYRVTNIGRAAELINKSIVLPGETWSLNQTVGERTVANGFVKGYIIKDGRFIEDLGGGVSQSATTTFNAVFFAGLKDVEHHPHSLYIGRYPAGREATVAFGSKDLRFENDSTTGIVIRAKHKVGYIQVEFWGTKHWDKIESISSPRYNIRTPQTIYSTDPGCEAQAPSNGFDIDVTRVFYKDGAEAKREKFHTSYQATDRIVCGAPPKPKDDKKSGDAKTGTDTAGTDTAGTDTAGSSDPEPTDKPAT